jgi:hypothetical protein
MNGRFKTSSSADLPGLCLLVACHVQSICQSPCR